VVHTDDRAGLGDGGADVRGADVLEIDALEQVRCQLHESFLETGGPRCAQRRRIEQRSDDLGRVLERLAVEEPGDEQIALLPECELVVDVDLGILGEKPLAFELDQRGRDQEELGGHLEIEHLHPFDLLEIGIDDAGEGDLVEVDLLAQDEMEQQVEGTFEHRCLHLVWHLRDVRRADTTAGALVAPPGRHARAGSRPT